MSEIRFMRIIKRLFKKPTQKAVLEKIDTVKPAKKKTTRKAKK